jgi:hypothetical protein
MRCGGVDAGACDVTKPISIGSDACQIDGKTVGPRGSGNALSHPGTGGFIGNLLPTGRQVRLAVGLLPVGQPRGPLMCQRPPASSPVAGRPPRGRLDRGWWAHAAPAHDGHLVRVERVVCGLTTRARLHVQGMAEDARDACVRPQVGQPGPR